MNNKHFDEIIKNKPKDIEIKYSIKQIKRSQLVTMRGNEIEKIYISIDGKLQVKNEFENGFIYNFAQIESMSYIGVMEIMAQAKIYTSTLQAITDCTIIEMSIEDFKIWVENDHNLALDVLKFLSSSMYKHSLNNGEKLAYPAIYLLTNYLINEYENSEKETFLIKKTREEIGSSLGVSVRTINRNLKILKEENLITINKRVISINAFQHIELQNKLDTII